MIAATTFSRLRVLFRLSLIARVAFLNVLALTSSLSLRQDLHAAELTKSNPSAVGAALGTIFSPALSPDIKTMGLAQRVNFVDFVKQVEGNLELAIVIDATESMEEQLAGVRDMVGKMLADLQRSLGDRVAFQIVTFRDVGYAKSVVEWPLAVSGHQFVRDMSVIQPALDQLAPGTGSPYFYEPADLALHDALKDLPWSTNANDARWILFIGDAPPYQAGFNEVETKAMRCHTDEQLVTLANERSITIHAIVCPTRTVDKPVYDQVIDELISFCSTLTSQTGGMMLDLSDPNVLVTIQQAASTSVAKYTAIEPITQLEIEEFRQNSSRANATSNEKFRVAVLPHLPREKMDFSRRNPAVLLADEMRSQLDAAGLDTVHMHQLEVAYFRLHRKSKTESELLQQISAAVGADYVLWGSMTSGDVMSLESGIFDAETLQFTSVPAVKARDASQTRLCSTVLQAVSQHAKSNNRPAKFAAYLPTQYKTRLVGSTPEVERLLGAARLSLELAIEREVGDAQAEKLYEEAAEDLQAVLRLEPQNPVAHSMAANVSFGRYQLAKKKEQSDAPTFLDAAKRSAADAYRNRNRANAEDAMEIEADLRFYQGRFAEAVAAYEKLISTSSSSEQARRSHWMLAGLFAGDWGVDSVAKEIIDDKKARSNALSVLANWPESHESVLFKRQLAWNEETGKTMSPHLPLSGTSIPKSELDVE